jgi:hypothetical protein
MADPNPFGLQDGYFGLELYTDKSVVVRANIATLNKNLAYLIGDMKGMYKDNWRGYPGVMFPRSTESAVRAKINFFHGPGYLPSKSVGPQPTANSYAQMLQQAHLASQMATQPPQGMPAAQPPQGMPTAQPPQGMPAAQVPAPNGQGTVSLPPFASYAPSGPRVLKNTSLTEDLEKNDGKYHDDVDELNNKPVDLLNTEISQLKLTVTQLNEQLRSMESRLATAEAQTTSLHTFAEGLANTVKQIIERISSETKTETKTEST